MKKVIIVLIVVFVFIQFFRIDKTNPPVNENLDFIHIKNTSASTAQILKNSCYDCHSNESEYPWYTNISPFSWLVKNHIDEGRKHLNFSEFATYDIKRQLHKLEEAVEEVERGKMPMESYLIVHQDARLSAAQQKELTDYFKQVRTNIKLKNEIE